MQDPHVYFICAMERLVADFYDEDGPKIIYEDIKTVVETYLKWRYPCEWAAKEEAQSQEQASSPSQPLEK